MQDIVFRGLTAPLRLVGAEAILPILRQVALGWPVEAMPARDGAAPFYTVTSSRDDPRLTCECHVDDRPVRRYDAVNAVCDVVAALALALPAERPELICLHAAGVEMAGRLVVFPNIRRAGKSALSAALAREGHRVFSDDVIPVLFPEGGPALGVAMGMAPRLRLPLPETSGQGFRDWVGQVAGPANRQYQYLRLEGQPAHGEALPVGAFVILDRRDDPVDARLDPVAPDEAMDALLHQHFTRDRHSVDILRRIADTLTQRPVFRLTYAGLDEAVACLRRAFAGWTGPGPTGVFKAPVIFRLPDPAPPPAPVAGPRARFGQRPGNLAVRLGQTLYLADAEGRAIHRMDPLAAAIWTLIEEPITRPDLVDLLCAAFPDAGGDRIAADIDRLLRHLTTLGLVVAG